MKTKTEVIFCDELHTDLLAGLTTAAVVIPWFNGLHHHHQVATMYHIQPTNL